MIITVHNMTPKMVNLLCFLVSSSCKTGNSGVLIFKLIKVIKRPTSITPTNSPGVNGLKGNLCVEFEKKKKKTENVQKILR